MTATTARPLVWLDTETTGLDPARHEIWEVAWAVDDGPIQQSFISHQRITLDIETVAAAKINGYLDRGGHEFAALGSVDWSDCISSAVEDELWHALDAATLAGACPSFDAAMLRARWGYAPWHYRLLDIEAYAAGWFGWSELRGLAGVAEALNVQAPDHTAAGDVHTVRECWRAMRAQGGPDPWLRGEVAS